VDFVAGDYSIADMALWPWLAGANRIGITFDTYPAVKKWHALVGARPGVQRGSVRGDELRDPSGYDERAKRILFGQR
jgi:GST-like protein